MKYCKKEDIINAIQFDGNNIQAIEDFIDRPIHLSESGLKLYCRLNTKSYYNVLPSDYIVMKQDGDVLVYSKKTFEENYMELK